MKVYLDTQILYLIHKTGVKDFCTAQNFLKGNIFIGGDIFLCTARDFLRDDFFVRDDLG